MYTQTTPIDHYEQLAALYRGQPCSKCGQPGAQHYYDYIRRVGHDTEHVKGVCCADKAACQARVDAQRRTLGEFTFGRRQEDR